MKGKCYLLSRRKPAITAGDRDRPAWQWTSTCNTSHLFVFLSFLFVFFCLSVSLSRHHSNQMQVIEIGGPGNGLTPATHHRSGLSLFVFVSPCLLVFVFLSLCLFVFLVFLSHCISVSQSRHHSDQMSEVSQVSKITLCVQILKWQWVRVSVSHLKGRYRAARAAEKLTPVSHFSVIYTKIAVPFFLLPILPRCSGSPGRFARESYPCCCPSASCWSAWWRSW